MHVAQGAFHEPQAIRALIVLCAVAAVIFWRIAFKIIIAAIAVIFLIMIITGVVAFFQTIHF